MTHPVISPQRLIMECAIPAALFQEIIMQTAHTATPTYEVHEGEDYVVVLAPNDTTDTATATFRSAETARQFVAARNAHADLVKALRTIACQSIGDDWTPEQALAFIKQHAKAAIAKANGQA